MITIRCKGFRSLLSEAKLFVHVSRRLCKHVLNLRFPQWFQYTPRLTQTSLFQKQAQVYPKRLYLSIWMTCIIRRKSIRETAVLKWDSHAIEYGITVHVDNKYGGCVYSLAAGCTASTRPLEFTANSGGFSSPNYYVYSRYNEDANCLWRITATLNNEVSSTSVSRASAVSRQDIVVHSFRVVRFFHPMLQLRSSNKPMFINFIFIKEYTSLIHVCVLTQCGLTYLWEVQSTLDWDAQWLIQY